MITVKQKDDFLLIKTSVTTFTHCMGYCEHKIPLYVAKIKPPKLEESESRKVVGKEAHKKEEIKDTKRVEEKIKIGEIEPIKIAELPWILPEKGHNLEFIRENLATKLIYIIKEDIYGEGDDNEKETNKENKEIRLVLTGIADKIIRNDENLIVEEDKFVINPSYYERLSKPFSNQLLQALIYLNSRYKLIQKNDSETDSYQEMLKHSKEFFGPYYTQDWFEIPHQNKKWIVNIRDKDHDGAIIRTFKGIQDQISKEYLDFNLERFAHIVTDVTDRYHHNSIKKCLRCEYNGLCKYSLILE